MIVITGAAGFIGSCCWASFLEHEAVEIGVVDDFSVAAKAANWQGKAYRQQWHRDVFLDWLEVEGNAQTIDFVIHLGARTDTTEKDVAIFDRLNLHYSQRLFALCARHQIPMIYASSAATYGMGERGYDDHCAPNQLHPLNPYGDSKNDFDAWVLEQPTQPPFWAGLKFFNVYGPNEYHKGRMASVVLHAFRQISETGQMRLFRSHHPDYRDGEQQRDFIYVKDVVNIIYFLYKNRSKSGLYNVGTGKARTFLDLVRATFEAMGKEPVISFIDTPMDIRDTYQYFTEARMDKIQEIGYQEDMYSLETGVGEYVREFLRQGRYW